MVVASISRALLNSMPDWELFLVIVGAVLAASLIGLFLTQRHLDGLRDAADAGVVAGVAATAVTLIAIVLAVSAISPYNQFNAAAASAGGAGRLRTATSPETLHLPTAPPKAT